MIVLVKDESGLLIVKCGLVTGLDYLAVFNCELYGACEDIVGLAVIVNNILLIALVVGRSFFLQSVCSVGKLNLPDIRAV